ncbi:MAG: alpha-L-glycero-D-manno-heptose beta-1,4-glucosyltransferase [Deltaproteobacteria bacterium RIFOXYD12_FULL_55_16]|nr:MAG: alpha-L-glycero-D-manno-heptose beta-1,4-glucosyltransferase [Deltaproteobacteria bacterium RIFOXYD12_FULL_55_16]
MSKISVYIIAYNEAEKIRAAINSVLWADEIVVVDSHSQDDTAEIAGEMGARVVQVAFNGFGELRNQAMAACRYDWIFSLDADERCTAAAKDEILTLVQGDSPADAYYIPRRNFFMGRWIKYSGFYPDYRQPQLFRKGVLHFQPDAVHEGFELRTSRPVGYLEQAIWQKPYRNFAEIQHKAGRYSTLGAQKLLAAGRQGGMATAFWRACWAFLQIYLLKLGFLDGWAGFVIAFGNFEGTFYKYAKLHELQASWPEPESLPLRRQG